MTATLFLTIDRERYSMKKKPSPKKPRVVEIVRSDYQPSKVELAEPIILGTTFEQLTHAVVQPVTIRTSVRPKKR